MLTIAGSMAAVSRKDPPLSVHVPSAGADRPSWGKVGVVAVIGFVIGVAWPKLAGVRLGPSAPSDAVQAAASAVAKLDVPSATIAAPQASASASAMASATPPPPAGVALTVARGVVITCKTEDGEALKGKDCGGAPAFDAIAQPRLKKLATLPALKDQKGKLGVVFALDFKGKKVGVEVGKSSAVKDDGTIKTFLKEQFQDVSLGPVAHEHERYVMSYSIGVGEGAAPAAGTPSGATAGAADGTSIVWDVAIVRDAPHTGAIVARLPRGTKVQVGTSQGGWYKITYNGSSEGWVYRGAIGK